MKNVIVAGAGGFIGKNLVRNLLDRGYKVTALDVRFDEDLQKSIECISIKEKTIDQIVYELNDEYDCFYNLAWVGTSGSMRADYNIQLDNARLTCDYVKLAAKIKCSDSYMPQVLMKWKHMNIFNQIV